MIVKLARARLRPAIFRHFAQQTPTARTTRLSGFTAATRRVRKNRNFGESDQTRSTLAADIQGARAGVDSMMCMRPARAARWSSSVALRVHEVLDVRKRLMTRNQLL